MLIARTQSESEVDRIEDVFGLLHQIQSKNGSVVGDFLLYILRQLNERLETGDTSLETAYLLQIGTRMLDEMPEALLHNLVHIFSFLETMLSSNNVDIIKLSLSILDVMLEIEELDEAQASTLLVNLLPPLRVLAMHPDYEGIGAYASQLKKNIMEATNPSPKPVVAPSTVSAQSKKRRVDPPHVAE